MVYECAYCTTECQPTGFTLTKWGQAHTYVCPSHGTYYIMDSPLHVRGQQVGPVNSWSESHDDDSQTT